MGRKGREITCVCFMELKDGRTVPVEELTEEEIERCRKSMTERFKRTVIDYYSRNPDKWDLLGTANV